MSDKKTYIASRVSGGRVSLSTPSGGYIGLVFVKEGQKFLSGPTERWWEADLDLKMFAPQLDGQRFETPEDALNALKSPWKWDR